MNEMSGRYSEMPEEFYVPDVDCVRKQSKTNKQGREEELHIAFVGKFIDRVNDTGYGAFKNYKASLDLQVARELARIQLPLGTYTEKVWQMNLHNLLHFLKLRTDSHAQWEIRSYALVIEDIISQLFPMTYQSWKNHIKDAVTFSADEWMILQDAMMEEDTSSSNLNRRIDEPERYSGVVLSKTRKAELKKKLGL